MRLQFLLFFILLATGLSAQSNHKIQLDPQALQLENRSFHIEAVWDNRKTPNSIGFVQKGLGNKRINATFDGPFSEYLLKTFQQLIPQKNTTPIIAKVHNLYVSERTTVTKEIGKVELEIEFLTADSSKTWGLFFAEVEGKGMDVTKKHNTRILEALSICLEQLTERWEETPMASIQRPIIAFDPSQPIKEGLYSTFTDFSNQTPINDIKYKIDRRSNQPHLAQLVQEANGKILKNYFGFSDGTNFYISATEFSYDSHYVQAEFVGTYCYFEDRVTNTGASIAFGLVGALASTKKKGFVLDTQTGLVSELNRDFLASILGDYPELKKQYNTSKKKLADKKAVLQAFNEVLEKSK